MVCVDDIVDITPVDDGPNALLTVLFLFEITLDK